MSDSLKNKIAGSALETRTFDAADVVKVFTVPADDLRKKSSIDLASGATLDADTFITNQLKVIEKQSEAIAELSWAIAMLQKALQKIEEATVQTLGSDHLNITSNHRMYLNQLLEDASALKESVNSSGLAHSVLMGSGNQE